MEICVLDQGRISVAQTGSILGDVERNSANLHRWLAAAAESGSSLVVFPECMLCGYIFNSRAEIEGAAINAEGPEIAKIIDWCEQLGIVAVFGFLELAGDRVFNTAAVIGPKGFIGKHRKRHLPYIGADRFVDQPADVEPSVFETPVCRIGVAVCYEIRFPEVFRTLALAGADVVALPTNWPDQSQILADQFTPVRAAENFVYVLAANRHDREGNVQFLGRSQIVDPRGYVCAHAHQAEGLITANLDLALARNKRIAFREGEFEISPWRDRRPSTYRL